MAQDIEITLRCKPFTPRPLGEYRLLVEPDGNILAWDDVAGHYTRLHSLSDGASRRARKMAKQAAHWKA